VPVTGSRETARLPPFRQYELRNSWATGAVESVIELVTLAAMLGHSKINLVLAPRSPDTIAPDEGDGEDGAVCSQSRLRLLVVSRERQVRSVRQADPKFCATEPTPKMVSRVYER
jgi:hypothetical protein